MAWWWIFPILAAFLLSLIGTDGVRLLASHFGIVDVPDCERKHHEKVTPLLGGLAIFGSMAIPTIAVLLFSDHFTSGTITHWHFLGFLFGGLILVVGGFLDDRFHLPPYLTILFPILAALSAVGLGIGVAKITNPLGGYFLVSDWLSPMVTFLWLIIMMYTTKLLDGLDGLASGVSAIGAFMVAALALTVAYFQPDVALLALIACAAILGFLYWNFPPAKIFLGEGGSTFLGYLIGVLAVIAGSKVATALLVLGVPAMDMFFVIIERLRAKKPIFFGGDRRHLHHRLRDLGLSPRAVIFTYWSLALVFGLTTLIFESWQKLVALGFLGLLMASILFVIIRKQKHL
ncbi:MAG: MraY family glycosyltransferase [Patescibacteria group bacterium]|jgi:UDP-GlcNAc:undecaprenyl-phosphate GlcNAc-1-phosphate transferase